MTHVTCRLTAKHRVSSGTLRLAIEYGLPLPFLQNGSNSPHCHRHSGCFIVFARWCHVCHSVAFLQPFRVIPKALS